MDAFALVSCAVRSGMRIEVGHRQMEWKNFVWERDEVVESNWSFLSCNETEGKNWPEIGKLI